MKLRTIAEAFGAAISLLLLRVWSLLSSYHPILYHSFLPMQSVVWGVLIELATLSLLAGLLFAWLRKHESGWRSVLWAFVAAELASTAVVALTTVHRGPISYLTPSVTYQVVLVGFLLFRWIYPLAFLKTVRGLAVCLALVGCSTVWMIPELLYQALRVQRHDAAVPVTRPNVAQSRIAKARIVWLLFDELSYNQAFEHRYPGIAMPAFDELKRHSTVFTDLKPAGYHTDRVVPAFLLGQQVDNVRGDLDGNLQLRFPGDRSWHPFDPQATLLADAQRMGWSTGIVGWYNPYCRILEGTFNYCFWRMSLAMLEGALPNEPAWRNAMEPMRAQWRSLRHQPPDARLEQMDDNTVITEQALTLLRDENIRFVFIHLPMPHPPGIVHDGGYTGNLGVADQVLSQLLKAVDGTSSVAETTLVVCSDHSWRVPMWRPTGFWSKQDEAASRGVFDPRPVLMVHTPGQVQEHDVTTPFDEIRIHEIMERLLRGQAPLSVSQ